VTSSRCGYCGGPLQARTRLSLRSRDGRERAVLVPVDKECVALFVLTNENPRWGIQEQLALLDDLDMLADYGIEFDEAVHNLSPSES
jgi:hypothetical protein